MSSLLVVEDDADQLELRVLLLRQAGFQVTAAGSAAEAAIAIECGRFDGAVVDLQIPHLEDGLSLLHQLQARDPHMRLLVLTGGAVPPGTPYDSLVMKGSGVSQLLAELQRWALL